MKLESCMPRRPYPGWQRRKKLPQSRNGETVEKLNFVNIETKFKSSKCGTTNTLNIQTPKIVYFFLRENWLGTFSLFAGEIEKLKSCSFRSCCNVLCCSLDSSEAEFCCRAGFL